eukprot:100160-Amphidinium_carterae.1
MNAGVGCSGLVRLRASCSVHLEAYDPRKTCCTTMEDEMDHTAYPLEALSYTPVCSSPRGSQLSSKALRNDNTESKSVLCAPPRKRCPVAVVN